MGPGRLAAAGSSEQFPGCPGLSVVAKTKAHLQPTGWGPSALLSRLASAVHAGHDSRRCSCVWGLAPGAAASHSTFGDPGWERGASHPALL
jgi:hypothetical protein